MIIKMVNEFKLTAFICAPKPDANLSMRVDLPLDNKTVWASGPPDRRAAGPSRAVGRGPLGLRAAGPPGRGGPWAAGRGPLGRGPAFSKTP